MEACDLARRWARSEAVGVSMTLSDPAIVQAFGERFHQLVDNGVDLLFCNEEEALAFTGTGELQHAVSELAHRVPIAAVTRGAGGALVVAGTTQVQVDAVPVQPVDTTGAGDSFAGGLPFRHLPELRNRPRCPPWMFYGRRRWFPSWDRAWSGPWKMRLKPFWQELRHLIMEEVGGEDHRLLRIYGERTGRNEGDGLAPWRPRTASRQH